MEKNLNSLLKEYLINLNDLRELLKLPGKFEKQAKIAKRRLDEIVLPVLIKKVESDLKSPPKNVPKKKIQEALDRLINEYKEIAPQNFKGREMILKIDGDYFSGFSEKKLQKERETFQHALSYKIHIERAVLFNLISYLEQVLSDVAHVILREYPEILCLDEKAITFSDLKTFSTLDDARESLISSEVEALLFKPLDDFFGFFEKKVFKITLPNLSELKEEILEIKERRNIFVHNSGIVNTKYINSIDGVLQKKFNIKKDEKVSLTKEYLLEAIQKVELVGLEILSYAAVKFQKEKGRVDAIWLINETIYNTFSDKEKNLFLGEKLASFLLGSGFKKYLNEQQRDYFQLNYWHILKKKGELELFKKESSKYDPSSKSHLIKLCYYSLVENYNEAFKHIVPSLSDEESFSMELYKTFPILEDLRKEKQAKEIIERFKERDKKI